MSTARRLHYDYAEYLRALEMSELRLEYQDGVIYAMAGGTPAHAELAASVIGLLHGRLPPGCRAATSDLKVRVEATDLSTFPDVTVVCGERKVAAIDANAITNPALLVEVTSKSTEDYDRGEKLAQYKQLPSLSAVLLVSHRTRRVTVVERAGGAWEEREAWPGDLARVRALALELPVDDIYEGILLDPA